MSTIGTQAGHTAHIPHTPRVGETADVRSNAILARARDEAAATGLAYAGEISPEEAWELVEAGSGTLIDIRSIEERTFVGYVPGVAHVAWATGTSLAKNPRFLRELEAKVPKTEVGILLCRSGKRSAAAATAAAKAGWTGVFNVREGFEGDLDARQQRGSLGGWRYRGLPWVQD
jgi:rhodanese-related sulfurtransferase